MGALQRLGYAIILSSCVAALYLFAPKVPGDRSLQHCIYKFPLTATRWVDANCDAPVFLTLAGRPDCLLAPTCRWQSRPLYVLIGSVLRIPFLSEAPTNTVEDSRDIAEKARDIVEEFRAAYIGYLIFNFAVLIAAVYLFESLLAGVGSVLVVHCLAVVLLTNDVVRLLVWSPHLQMLTLVMPLIAIAAARHLMLRPALSFARAAGYGLAAGFAPLLYGSGLLLLPAMVMGVLLRPRFGRHDEWRTLLAQAAVMSAAFAVPLGVWMLFLIVRNGAFYSHEVARFRQFVWLLDAYRAGGLGRMILDVANGALTFGEKLLRIGWLPIALALGALRLTVRDEGGLAATVQRARPLVVAAVAALLLNVLFFVLMGYYTERLSLNAVPPLLVLTGVLLAGQAAVLPVPQRRILHAALCTVVLCWTVWQGTKHEPWSFFAEAVNASNPYRPPESKRRYVKAREVRYKDCPIQVLAQPEIEAELTVGTR